METTQRVLVVDGRLETEEVLRQVFEPRGLEVCRVRPGGMVPFPTSPAARPRVIVLNAEDVPGPLSPTSAWDDVPRVVIGGRMTISDDGSADCRNVPALFQYGELISAIECLLERRAA